MRSSRTIALASTAATFVWGVNAGLCHPSYSLTATPSVTPSVTPSETPVETPIETPSNTSVETPIETPGETPAEPPAETPTPTPIDDPTPPTPAKECGTHGYIQNLDGEINEYIVSTTYGVATIEVCASSCPADSTCITVLFEDGEGICELYSETPEFLNFIANENYSGLVSLVSCFEEGE
ncbi:hypothetical protein EDB81DRAFT_914244 [Dactylonectria macrodidyma]|uniref:Apple domain-containing protein n=1 Tax=Dactylonectria macrodidyma TaxID=307937 RepID=A0A9P9III9_9HYPO|nr:hypothetical protein EDB81DRAFT_914244 [Dactylonectria macrodidyma]